MEDPLILPLRAQLTYTSVETKEQGGWQVKEQLGELDDSELQLTLGLIPTRMPAPQQGLFVSSEEAMLWPRRLAHMTLFRPGKGQVRVLLNSVSAGQDRSGREGNVFTHCGFPDNTARDRPIMTWRSPTWLVPFGPDQVATASLEANGLQLSPMLADEVVVFLSGGETWRPGVLAVLLDALHARITRDAPVVVLVVGDTDEAASWIKTVSICMSSRSARSFSFSTYEFPGSEESWDRIGFHLVCVLRGTFETLARAPGIVVIDTADPGALGVLDEDPHRTSRGDRIEVSAWSTLMFELVAPAEDLRGYLTTMDRLEDQIRDDADLLAEGMVPNTQDPAWWMALMHYSVNRVEVDDEVVRLVAIKAPTGVTQSDVNREIVQAALLATMGASTEERWEKLHAMVAEGMGGHMKHLATSAYVESALTDPSWLASAEAVVPPHAVRIVLTEHMAAVAEGLLDSAGLSEEERTLVGLRFLQLTGALGWQQDSRIVGVRERMGEAWLGPALMNEQVFSDAMGRAGQLGEEELAALREQAYSLAYTHSLHPWVLRELGLMTIEFLESHALATMTLDIHRRDAALSPLALQVLDALWQSPRDDATTRRLAHLVVRAEAQARATNTRRGRNHMDECAGLALRAHEAGDLVKMWGHHVPNEMLALTIFRADPEDPHLAGLLELLIAEQYPFEGNLKALASAAELVVSGLWRREEALGEAWAAVDAFLWWSDLLDREVPSTYARALTLLGTCAAMGKESADEDVLRLSQLPPVDIPDSQISLAAPLAAAQLLGGASWSRLFPYMTKRELLSPRRHAVAHRLTIPRGGTGASVAERLVAAVLDAADVSPAQLRVYVEDWVQDEFESSRAGQPKVLERDVMSWARRHVKTSDTFGQRLLKGFRK